MKTKIVSCIAAAAFAAMPLAGHALGNNEKGCLVGGAAGGVGGHFLGGHEILGAAAGCAVGTYVARDKALKERQAQKRHHTKSAQERERDRERRERQQESAASHRSAPAS
jgi:Ni/Co efflux regulator RcnB